MLSSDFQNEVIRRYKLQKEYLGNDKSVNLLNPLVSVCIQTYNHEKYIKECLDSILLQKTNFDFEIILGEDDSNDATRQICIDYANKHKNKIRLFLRDRETTQLKDKNGTLLRRLNGIFTRMTAKGKYIALCEGDDYWTDPLKLQKQVDFMENNKDYSACFTNATIVNELDKTTRLFVNYIKEGNVSLFDIILRGGGIYPTASIVYRSLVNDNQRFIQIPELAGDTLLIINAALLGKIFFIDNNTNVYRQWSGGVYSGIMNDKSKLIDLWINNIVGYKKLNSATKYKYSKPIKVKLSKLSLNVLSIKINPKTTHLFQHLSFKDCIHLFALRIKYLLFKLYKKLLSTPQKF